MTPSDVLDAAADLIERDGWFGSTEHGVPNANCAFTAILNSTSDVIASGDALRALNSYLGFQRIIPWNDAQDGPDKVVWTMRQVAADLREGGG